jgi:DNA-binding transcriptional LysR family regulator
MELRHLRYFVAVGEEGHITRAAERLGIQQPPLSKQIGALERELDVRLLRRTGRGVELTDAGRALLDLARSILTLSAQAVETTRRTARGEQGRICVGVAPTGPFHPFVPRVIRAFREAWPLVSLSLEESFTNDLVDRIRDEKSMSPSCARRCTIPRGSSSITCWTSQWSSPCRAGTPQPR